MRPILTPRPLVVGVVTAAALGLLGGCTVHGNGQSATDTRSLGDFDSIDVSGALPVEVSPGLLPSASVTCDENLLPYIHTEVKGRTLSIEERGEHGGWVNLDPEVDCWIAVVAPALEALEISGSSDVVVEEGDPKASEGVTLDALQDVALSGSGTLRVYPLQALEALSVEISGSGDARFDALSLGRLSVELSGSGRFQAAGSAHESAAELSGSGDLWCRHLVADHVSVEISGAGHATVQATESVEVEISGSGDVDVWGEPPSVDTEISGSGDVDLHGG